jgi:serine/threonine protein kinase
MESFIDSTIEKLSQNVLKKLSDGNIVISKVILGKGTFAEVNLGYIVNSKTLVALKMINKIKINQKISELFETSQ